MNSLKKNRIVILGTFTVDLLTLSIQAVLEPLLPVEVQTAPYHQIFQELLNPSSLTMTNQDGYANVIVFRVQDFLEKNLKASSTNHIIPKDIENLIRTIQTASQACHIPWIICLCPSGSHHAEENLSTNCYSKLERHIQDSFDGYDNIYIINPDSVLCLYSLSDFYDPISQHLGDIPYKYEYFCALGYRIARMVYSIITKPYKVIVLDCDDTLWSGICGEDRLEDIYIYPHQLQFQQLLLEQIQAGMLLCLCSKNNEEDVKKVFQSHPDMILKLENFVSLKINWKEKSSNIYELSHQLNLNLDSFIFIDDNLMECAEVSSRFPQILTLQLPKNPEKTRNVLQHFWSFDHPKVTSEDHQRTAFYQQEAHRFKLKEQSDSLQDFIENLQLNIKIEPIESRHNTRISQLIKRCNQFNFTQTSEKDFWELLKDESTTGYIVTVHDRYGEYGESGVILTYIASDVLSIKTFLLSCRVLGKGVEHRIVAWLGKMTSNFQLDIKALQFYFSKSKRNLPAQKFFSSLCELSHAEIEKIDEISSIVKIEPQVAMNLTYAPSFISSETNVDFEQFTNLNIDSEKEKILIRYATYLDDLENLVNTVRAYQKVKQGQIQKKTFYIGPGNSDEEYLQKAFERILHTEKISIDDNFFSLGGSSLMGTLLIAELCQFYSIYLTIDVLFEAPTIRELAKVIHENKFDLNFRLERIQALHRAENEFIPLSFAQQRIWFLDQLHPLSTLYNTFIAFELHGTIDEIAIIKSFDTVIERHESLRTTFSIKSGIPYQVIHSKSACKFQVEIIDIGEMSDDKIRQRVYEIAQQPFDLRTAPLLRVILLRHRQDRYFLLFCSHHIIMDGRSFNILMLEFSKLYTIYHRNEFVLDWLPPQIQYADFSVWQRKRLDDGLRRQQLAYWSKQLANLSPLDFPSDFMRSDNIDMTGKRIPFHFDKSLLNKLRMLSHRAKVTLFTTVLTACAILFNKYTEKTDIVIGTPIAGRQYPGVENMIGHFINILILRLDLSGNSDFLTLLERNHHTVLEAYIHQDLPFEELVKALNPNRQITENPLTQVMLVFQESDHEIIQIPDIKLTKVFSDNDQLLLLADYDHAKLDMTIDVQVTSQGLEGLIEYNSCLYSEKTIAGIIRHLHNILFVIGDNPKQPCSTLSMLDQDEYHKILYEWNQTMTRYPCQATVTQLFEKQAQAQPDQVAIVFYEQQITYRFLNQKANQLAYYLQTKNIRAQMLVGLYLNRSIDLIIAILAVFKIGAVYVPISPDLPKRHSRGLIEDSQIGVILTHQSLFDQANDYFNHYHFLNILRIDRLESLDQAEQSNRMDVNLISRITPQYIAAMIYTSGSTGQPKGVLIKHQGLVNTTYAQIQYLNITPRSRIMQVASMNFDASLWDILGALVSGATLCLVNQEDVLNTYRFVELLQELHITLMTVTPSYLSALPRVNLPELQTLVVAGESCPVALVKYWAKNRQFVNAYGLTETTICATMATLTEEIDTVTIGQPIANTQVYVLSQDLQPMPVGVPGELYIAGDGVAQGYHQRNELNQQSFILNPYCPHTKMYKTGDRVRWLSNGHLEYVGRNDDVVKIRGIRTELNAIARVLDEHPLVNQTAVIFQDYPSGEQKLIAYLVLRNSEKQCVLNSQHMTHWQVLYNDLYATGERPSTEGWESSYTNQPISFVEMEEWIKNSVDRIKMLSPDKLLEIGCGNGLLVQRIAPLCRKYVATDFSQNALDILKSYCLSQPTLQHVQVKQRPAHEYSEEEKDSYDTIVLNSVIQYFPHIDYLISVLDQCTLMLQSQGQIFIGDVRNLNYQSAFHSDVQFYKSKKNQYAHNLTFGQWKQQVEAQILRDPELVIAPDFFHWYAKRNPKITHITIELRRGNYPNEMNCFRYDVVLHVGKPVISSSLRQKNYRHYDWQKDNLNLEKIEAQLQNSNYDVVIYNVPNQRIDQAVLLTKIPLLEADQPALPIIEQYLQVHSIKAFDPETFWKLGEKLSCYTIITFSKNQENAMDIVYIQKNHVKDSVDLLNCIANPVQPKIVNINNEYNHYANFPMNTTISKLLTKQMQEFLHEHLPSHMIPATFIALDKMPMTINGKIDKAALPNAHLFFIPIHPSSPVIDEMNPQSRLRRIFSDVLNLPVEQIGDQDSFFDIGGHSLLAIKLIKEIESVFSIEFSIRDLFKASTIHEITEVMQMKQKTMSAISLNDKSIV